MKEIFKDLVINEQMLTGNANLWETISNSDVNREQFTDIITKKLSETSLSSILYVYKGVGDSFLSSLGDLFDLESGFYYSLAVM